MSGNVVLVAQEEPEHEEEVIALFPLNTQEDHESLLRLFDDISPERARELLNEMFMRAED